MIRVEKKGAYKDEYGGTSYYVTEKNKNGESRAKKMSVGNYYAHYDDFYQKDKRAEDNARRKKTRKRRQVKNTITRTKRKVQKGMMDVRRMLRKRGDK